MSVELDNEQNRRIRDVEARINEVENQMSAILAKLEQATTLLKVVGIALGAMIGIDVQGMVV
jgi:phosphopantetheine adenylyltransferase